MNLEKDPIKKLSTGRPVVKDLDAKFNLLCEWLESEAEVHSLAEKNFLILQKFIP